MRILFLALLLSAIAAAKPVTLDGRDVDLPTTVQNGRTMVELRALTEELGWRLEYRNGRAVIFTDQSARNPSKTSVSPPEPIPSEEILSPEDESVTYNLRPEIAARFRSLLAGDQPFRMLVNGKDVTSEAKLQANEVRWRPARQIGAGLHKIELTVVDQSGNSIKREWSFRVKNRLSY